MSVYNTIYSFVQANRVEVTCQPGTTIHNCYINYKGEGDRPWGSGGNILDAIERGVINYLNMHSQNVAYPQAHPYKKLPSKLEFREFALKDDFIFYYWFACKNNIAHLIQHYEEQAYRHGDIMLDSIKFIVVKAKETIENINAVMDNKYPAIYNLLIQPIVYYESLKTEKYENLIVVRDILAKSNDEYRKDFADRQERMLTIETEILKKDE